MDGGIGTSHDTGLDTTPGSGHDADHDATAVRHTRHSGPGAVERSLAVQDRLASWVCDLSLVHELTERLARRADLDDALHEVLRAGATLLGARRGLIALEPADGLGPDITVGLGLGHADLGTIETVPRPAAHAAGRPRPPDPGEATGDGAPADLPDGAPAATTAVAPEGTDPDTVPDERLHPDLLHEPGLDPRHREVAQQLGLAASYSLQLVTGLTSPLDATAADPAAAPSATLTTPAAALAHGGTAPRPTGRLGTAVWFYDEPAQPIQRQRRLMGLYLRFAAEHLARVLDLVRARETAAALAAELLPARLPRVPGVRMAVRHSTGPRGGGDWFDALPLPEGALGLAVGGVTGAGPSAVAAMGRLRASLRAYAVIEGEDPVAVLSDLELLMRLTEPARSATALFTYVEAAPTGRTGGRKLILAGAGHCPPLVVGDRRCEYVETSLSAPLNMLSCWEAPSVELRVQQGESLLLYTDGLLHRTGEPADRAFARLHTAAQSAPRPVREDPEQLADHVLHALLPDGLDRTAADSVEDVVLLAVHFD
ncbi:PP2C family protein-serine/threonine phosphatase [Streptomyces sp. NPDC051976]|uniref:PP2C family protein-serine/threonine phosphatase n=1 Tax=Streptomyces sp. NPDC051976 TaxID=3154947 RepID=UPI0034254E7A